MEMVNDALAEHERTGIPNASAGRLPVSEFLKYVEETRQQPAFRNGMDTAVDYYDGNQLTAETLASQDAMGFGSLMTNLIKPSIDTVLGIEAKNRTDFRCVSDDDKNQAVAEAMSAKLAEAERQSRADRACSDAYSAQVKAGLGWVHVARESDPFLYPYRTESVHRREMFWDWSARDPNLTDARYVIRQKWYPVDQVIAALPKHKDLILASSGGWQPDWIERARENTTLMNAIDQESRMSMTAWEWRNVDNRRVALQECWYAVYVRGLVLRTPQGKTVEFNKKNPMHMAVVGAGALKPEPAVYRKLRCSMWFGPHVLQDYDAGKNKLPYVPFWGFREDLTGVPYGLVRTMIPLQDEVNARRRKLMWLLSSKRVQIDSDALDARYNEFADIVNEIARPDSMVVLNPARKNTDALKVESDLGLSQQQFEILQEAKEGIQAAAGIFNSIMGKTDGAKSGVAVNALVEQSSNTLGELNDNFKMARQRVGELLVDLIRQDLSGQQVDVMTGASSSRRKTIHLNVPKRDELTGMEYRENDTDKADFKVALEDVPSTAAYRQQQMMTIGETMKAMPPELQAAVMPFYLEATDLPRRQEMAKTLRTALGQTDENGEEVDPQVAQLKQQLQAVTQQSEQAMDSYEQAVQEAHTKLQSVQTENQMLKVQGANKAGELELKATEIQAKREELAAAVKEREASAQAKLEEARIKGVELEIKQAELALEATKLDGEQRLRESEIELKRGEHGFKDRELGMKSEEMEHNQLIAAQGPGEEPIDAQDVKAIVAEAMKPLIEELQRTKEELKRKADDEALVRKTEDKTKKQLEREKAAKAAEPGDEPDSEEQRRVSEKHEADVGLTKAKTKAVGAKPAGKETTPDKPSAKPGKRKITFLRDKVTGKLSGAEIDG